MPVPAQDKELYDVMAAARRVKRTRKTMYDWMDAGMPFRVIGGHRYIAHEDLLAMLRQKLIHARELQWKAGGQNPRVKTPVPA
jgi:hypothetical protein